LCERLETCLDAPYVLRAGPVRVSASVGLALVDSESSVAGLLADADIAMFDAKAAHRGDPTRSLPERQRSADQRRRLADDLTIGLQRGEVVAYLQPITDIVTRRTTSVEALARWHHPQLGTLEPASFLDLAGDAGLDLLLGDIILESACAAVAAVPGDLQLAVNFSVAQLSDPNLCSRVAVILARHGLPTSRLWVEITEHATLARRGGGSRVSPERTLLDLCEMGVSLSLDDFGTGYSSLTHIRRYPLSAIKIDRSFVRGVAHHREDQAVIAAVVGLAGMLGLQVVGEGVESIEQLDALRRLGCDAVQGYLVARPMSAESFRSWMSGTSAVDWSTSPSHS
jgi:EAL domain-containing protein (putative c-di-GMP-specific phosphodiesterase class I)